MTPYESRAPGLGPRLAAVLIACCCALGTQSLAQPATGERRSHVGAGIGLYSGMRNEEGVGVSLRFDVERRLWQGAVRLEAVGHRFTSLGGTCTTGVPGACYPESPPPYLASLTGLVAAPITAWLYPLVAIGVYVRGPTARHAALFDVGVEVGTGLRLSRRVRFELRLASVGTAGRWGHLYAVVLRRTVRG